MTALATELLGPLELLVGRWEGVSLRKRSLLLQLLELLVAKVAELVVHASSQQVLL